MLAACERDFARALERHAVQVQRWRHARHVEVARVLGIPVADVDADALELAQVTYLDNALLWSEPPKLTFGR